MKRTFWLTPKRVPELQQFMALSNVDRMGTSCLRECSPHSGPLHAAGRQCATCGWLTTTKSDHDDSGHFFLRPERRPAGGDDKTSLTRCRYRRRHQFQPGHFLGYDPAGGFPSPPTAYRRGRRAQERSRTRTCAPPSSFKWGDSLTGPSTMAGLERRVEYLIADGAHRLGCSTDAAAVIGLGDCRVDAATRIPTRQHRSMVCVRDSDPHGRRRALRVAPGRRSLRRPIARPRAPSRGGTPTPFAVGLINAANDAPPNACNVVTTSVR